MRSVVIKQQVVGDLYASWHIALQCVFLADQHIKINWDSTMLSATGGVPVSGIITVMPIFTGVSVNQGVKLRASRHSRVVREPLAGFLNEATWQPWGHVSHSSLHCCSNEVVCLLCLDWQSTVTVKVTYICRCLWFTALPYLFHRQHSVPIVIMYCTFFWRVVLC